MSDENSAAESARLGLAADASSTVGGISTESLLGLADDTSLVLRDRLLTAKTYTVSWIKAVGGGGFGAELLDSVTGGGAGADDWEPQIVAMQAQLDACLSAIPVDSVFPSKAAVVLYNKTSGNWAQLFRALYLSSDTLPEPDLLTQAASLSDAILQAPAAAAKTLAQQISNALAKLVGGTVAALWPWLALGGLAVGVYVFRAPLGRLVGKVAK